MASEVPVVADGRPYQWTPPGARDYNYYYVGRAPRSAIGVTADNHVLLVVVDGRRPPSAIGVSYANVAELMIALLGSGPSGVIISPRPTMSSFV